MKLRSLFISGLIAILAVLTPISMASADSGGVPSICNYYSDAQMNHYTFSCYSSVTRTTLTRSLVAEGNHVFKRISSDHRLFDTARSYVDAFASSANAYEDATMDVARALVTGAAATVGGGVAGAAIGVADIIIEGREYVEAFSTVRSNLSRAYNAISRT